ncbi:MAG TPA: PIG-L family deacetylase [Thermoanaerobaculia bacterium]|nr:PIG-L family deacetylase [Thermoanaerobaculia bacterium]
MTLLVVVAHPDDVTIGAGGMLTALVAVEDVHVVQLTEDAARADEARRALLFANVNDVRTLGCPDQEAVYYVRELTEQLRAIIEELRPSTIVTTAYEGGHPDHDACAMIVQTLGQAIEMPLYHARNGSFCPLQFADGRDGIIINLDDEQCSRKRRMLECYTAPREELATIPIVTERFRVAPCYDFSLPPHAGALWYEILGFPIDGATWRRAAADAFAYA